MAKKKQVKDTKTLTSEKQVREKQFTYFNRPIYSFVALDLHGPYCWSVMTGQVLIDVLEKLKGYEGMNWQSLTQKHCHLVETKEFSDTASKRLKELNLDDFEELYSLRLSGKERIWGIKDGDWLKIVWWDPNHEVCPSKLKHT